jgi:IS30 family transposase
LRVEIESLDSRERLRLSCYYIQDLTLAEVGRLLGEHEATVSRKLARTRGRLRARIEERLRATHGLRDGEIDECFACAAGEWPFDLTAVLRSESG